MLSCVYAFVFGFVYDIVVDDTLAFDVWKHRNGLGLLLGVSWLVYMCYDMDLYFILMSVLCLFEIGKDWILWNDTVNVEFHFGGTDLLLCFMHYVSLIGKQLGHWSWISGMDEGGKYYWVEWIRCYVLFLLRFDASGIGLV